MQIYSVFESNWKVLFDFRSHKVVVEYTLATVHNSNQGVELWWSHFLKIRGQGHSTQGHMPGMCGLQVRSVAPSGSPSTVEVLALGVLSATEPKQQLITGQTIERYIQPHWPNITGSAPEPPELSGGAHPYRKNKNVLNQRDRPAVRKIASHADIVPAPRKVIINQLRQLKNVMLGD